MSLLPPNLVMLRVNGISMEVDCHDNIFPIGDEYSTNHSKVIASLWRYNSAENNFIRVVSSGYESFEVTSEGNYNGINTTKHIVETDKEYYIHASDGSLYYIVTKGSYNNMPTDLKSKVNITNTDSIIGWYTLDNDLILNIGATNG